MAPAPSRLRGLVLAAGAVGGLIVGLLVVATVTGERAPPGYRPFPAGLKADRIQDIEDGGPVLIPDPRGGDRSFYLDLEAGEIVALHVVPPGGSARCPVQWDRDQRRYEDCDGTEVARDGLARFVVTTRVDDEDGELVFVDLRELVPPPTPPS